MRKIFVLSCVLSIASCGMTEPDSDTDNLVSVSSIIGSMKCAFAEALIKEAAGESRDRLKGRVVAGTLTLNVVSGRTSSVSAGAKAGSEALPGPFVFNYRGAQGSILPSFSRSVERSNTAKTEIKFRYLLQAKNTDACGGVPKEMRDGYGFSKWISETVSGLDIASEHEPRGVVEEIKYTAEFGVKKTGSHKAQFDIIFLSAGGEATQTRNDVQSLTFTIAPENAKTNPRPGDDPNGTVGRLTKNVIE